MLNPLNAWGRLSSRSAVRSSVAGGKSGALGGSQAPARVYGLRSATDLVRLAFLFLNRGQVTLLSHAVPGLKKTK